MAEHRATSAPESRPFWQEITYGNSTAWTEGGQSSPPPSPRGRTGEFVVISQQPCAKAKSNWIEVLTASSLLRFLGRFCVSEPRGPRGQAAEVPSGTQQDPTVDSRWRPQSTEQAGPGSRGTCRWRGTLETLGRLLPLVCVCVFVSARVCRWTGT